MRSKLEWSQLYMRVTKTHWNWIQRLDLALNNESRNLLTPLPVQPGPLLTLMMEQLQNACGVLVSSLIRLWFTSGEYGWLWHGYSLQKLCFMLRHRWDCPYKLPTRGTRRGCGLPADWAKAVYGWRLNWKGSVRITRKCGHMTMNVLEQSRNETWWKTATPLRFIKWWSGLTNCSVSLKPLAPKFHSRESEAETHGKAKTLVLLLKQYHSHYYWFYEKGTTRAMVGLQGLHTCDTFWCTNVSSSVGLKSFCPWCFRLGGNTGMIATHLREIHYWLATVLWHL